MQYTVHCTLYTVHCTLYRWGEGVCMRWPVWLIVQIHYTLYIHSIRFNTMHCTVQCTLLIQFGTHCTLDSVHCTLDTLHCVLYSVQCTVYTVHCHCYLHHLLIWYPVEQWRIPNVIWRNASRGSCKLFTPTVHRENNSNWTIFMTADVNMLWLRDLVFYKHHCHWFIHCFIHSLTRWVSYFLQIFKIS